MIQRFTGEPINVPETFMDVADVALFQNRVKQGDQVLRRVTSVQEIEGYSKGDGRGRHPTGVLLGPRRGRDRLPGDEQLLRPRRADRDAAGLRGHAGDLQRVAVPGEHHRAGHPGEHPGLPRGERSRSRTSSGTASRASRLPSPDPTDDGVEPGREQTPDDDHRDDSLARRLLRKMHIPWSDISSSFCSPPGCSSPSRWSWRCSWTCR